jgi:outer membrane protein insertion porin family
MAEKPITPGRCRRVVLCALTALIGLSGSVCLGQMPPEGHMIGPDGRSPLLSTGSSGRGGLTPSVIPPAPMPGLASPLMGPLGVGAFPVPAEEMVVAVRIEGNRTVPLDKILPKIRTRAQRPYNEDLVQQDVRDLYKMGVFAGVRPLRQKVQGGVIVTFQVAERPLLQEVIIVGNDTYLTSVLKKEAELKVGDAADPFAVENGRRRIEDYYQRKGYSKVRVTVLEGNKPGDLRAVFVVDEGPRQRVFWVNFVGNQFVTAARLKTIIQTHPPYFYLFAGEVDRKQIDEDVAKLTAYYRGFGFFKATVGRELEFNEKQNWLTITFVVDEGPRYFVRNISFLGNRKFDNGRLAAKLKLLNGQAFDQNQQNLDLQNLRDEYGGDGYVFAKVEADNRFLEEPGKLDIVYNVEEGSRYRFGRLNIAIKGENPHTQITTILNRLSFKPGDVVDTREIRNSERRLKAAQLFKVDPMKNAEPKITYSPPDSEDKDTMLAGKRRTSYYRVPGGDAPLPPGEGYLDLNVSAETQDPKKPYAPCWRATDPQPTFQGQTFQQSPYDSQVALGQAYPLPRDPRDAPRTFVRFSPPLPPPPSYCLAIRSQESRPTVIQTRYEPSDGWTQPQPQSQNWTAAGGNNVTSGGQASQNYPAQPQPEAWQASGYANAGSPGGQPQNYPAQPQTQPWPANGYANSASYVEQPIPNYAVQPQPAPVYYNPPAATANNGTQSAPPSGYAAAPAYGQPAPNYGAATGASPQYSNPAASSGDAPPGLAPSVYTPRGPATNKPVAEMAAANDMFNNPEPSMVPGPNGDPLRPLPADIIAEETQTGRLMFGVGVNSDAGLVGNITLDEQNFDWTKVPSSWEDIMEGRAFRGAGERFRLELVPGTVVQRYMINYQQPYFMDRPVSFGLSGFFYQRLYTEWTESRAGGSMSWGYQFTHDLTGSVRFQGQDVDIKNPEYPVPSLLEVLGHNQLYSVSLSLQHDTRDNPFMATEGHLLVGSIGENFGTYQYPTASVEWSQYFRIFERADRSGKHVLSFSARAMYSGDNTPIFEKFYAGGFSSIRGFAFRGVTPRDPVYGMGVGGDFQMLATAQYMFPITADDMLKGVFFVDAGTVQPRISNWVDTVRVAPGFGLRISIPMMGPAPIALDFAFPILQQDGDQTQMFSFFVGFNH